MIRRPAGPAIGVDERARVWVRANEGEPEPRVERLPPDTIVRRWRGPSPGSDVDFYAVHGAGHTWPGSRLALPRALFGRTSHAFDATHLGFLHSHARDP
jgi:poly(3-hydroxybutyrate) depolymerase